MNIGLEKLATKLRSQPTTSEALLRDALCRRGHRFDFNQPLHGFIPDYYFPDHKKIVELDGAQFHDAERDAKRDAIFEAKGIPTFRIRSYRVFTDLRGVLRSIEVFLGTAKPRTRKKKRRQRGKGSSTPKWAKVLKLTKDHLPKRKTK